ncbi:aspartyl-phosphate phosphatase Spo0E family protein [Bacillus sp. Marseille-P3661]|uniref:aspartyl-phosphate phosphatase Spo0E family protein n=1 Tax=Bacillus sp. Marseille-P3661 TaxID=1936234 RepID=UPI000C81B816|nr:aspartyl-phosphate phosphatase Spo0E family protein [Bacillus sp. Marseille-P3661]
MKVNTTVESTLLKEIDFLRAKLITSGITNGMRDPQTIHLSQQLDQLLNKYNDVTRNKVV